MEAPIRALVTVSLQYKFRVVYYRIINNKMKTRQTAVNTELEDDEVLD